jgi:hypothetical protein
MKIEGLRTMPRSLKIPEKGSNKEVGGKIGTLQDVFH